MAKNLYTSLYIYAKSEAIMYKYTAMTPVFRGLVSGKFYQTRTVFEVIGGVRGPREGHKSNNLLQNSSI